jgi:antitoxin component YwqK of YwqJK toxin-antitoxin module/tetratricopeptide (TPR) repeat protein
MIVGLRIILLFFCLGLASGTTLFGQEPDADSSGSHALVEKGIKLNDDGKYADALACYNRVSKCDPNYRWALFESALTLNRIDAWAEALKKCDEAISLHYEIPQLYVVKGTILDQSGRTREGAEVIGAALKTWPCNQGLLFNLAVCQANMQQYELAEKTLLKSIRINPYHPGSHLALAKMNLFMGRTGQAYLAFNMAVLLNPRASVLTQYENAIFGKYDSLIHAWQFAYRPGTDSVKWKALAGLLRTGIPYNNEFEFPYKPDYKIMRMSMILMESISYDRADTSLYNQFYVRFFTGMMQEFGFGVFINYCLKNIENPEVGEWMEKHRDEYDKFVKWAQERFNSGRSSAFSPDNESNGVEVQHYEDGVLAAVGPMTVKDSTKRGLWISLDESGCVKDRGSYENGKKNGEWFLYWPNAVIKQHLVYREGLLDGTCSTYGKNGSKSGVYQFEEGRQVGREEHFTLSGMLSSFVTFVADTADGPAMKTDYEGWFKRDLTNSHGKANGMITETWLNGAKKFSGNFRNDLRDGLHRFWYPNDSPESEETYLNDTLSGTFRNYHRNGKLSREGTYDEKGRLKGVVRNYSRQGLLSMVDSAYDGNVLQGTSTEYYSSGKLKEVVGFEKGERFWIKSFDSAGNMIWQAVREEGLLHYRGFYPDGRLMLEGDYRNSRKHGVWTTYSPSGTKTRMSTYADDQLAGIQEQYHKNGRLKERFVCDSNRIVGDYFEYYPLGNLKSKGFYRPSGAQGDWFTYYPDDSLETRSYLVDGKPVGCVINLTKSHRTDTEIYFEDDGTEIGTRFYDRKGNLSYDWDYRYGESKGTDRFPGGQVRRVITMRDNLRNGAYEIYYPNGKQAQLINYCSGRAEGIMKTWAPDGSLLMEGTFGMGQWNGLRKDYAGGKLTDVTPFEDNNLEGTGTEYDGNGRVICRIEWSGGLREGNSDYFSPDGTLMYRVVYWGDVVAGFTGCGPDGRLLPLTPVTLATTEMSTRYPDGKPAMNTGLKAGLYHGKFTAWYPDGNIMKEGFFVDDECDGVFRSWYPAKIPRETISYTSGYRNGPYQSFHPNGTIRLKGNYDYDQEIGEWELFDENGKHTATYVYDSGTLNEIRTF